MSPLCLLQSNCAERWVDQQRSWPCCIQHWHYRHTAIVLTLRITSSISLMLSPRNSKSSLSEPNIYFTCVSLHDSPVFHPTFISANFASCIGRNVAKKCPVGQQRLVYVTAKQAKWELWSTTWQHLQHKSAVTSMLFAAWHERVEEKRQQLCFRLSPSFLQLYGSMTLHCTGKKNCTQSAWVFIEFAANSSGSHTTCSQSRLQ